MTDREIRVEPTLQVRGAGCRAPLLVERLPSEVAFGFLEKVLPTTEPVELVLQLLPVPTDRAVELLERARTVAAAEMTAPAPGAETSRLEAEQESAHDLARAVARRVQELWRVGIVFEARTAGRARVARARSRLADRLTSLGFRPRVPTYEVSDAVRPPEFDGSESRPRSFWHTLPTDAVAAFFPFGDESLLEPNGILIGLALADASPVFLNRWDHASHSWGLFGTTGSGKSFAAALFALRTRWTTPDLDLVVLDPLGEFGSLVERMGGRVLRLADPTAGRVNPLDPVTTSGDRVEKSARVVTALRALYPSLRDEEGAVLDAAVRRLYEDGPAVPTFDDLMAALPPGGGSSDRLRVLLDVFRSGSLAGANGPTTVRTDASPLCFDLSGVPDEHLGFHLTYLLDWVYGRIRDHGGPTLVLLDEAHLLARHPAAAEFLDRTVRHIRHFRAGLLLLSQNPDDFLTTPSGRSTLRNLYATGFLHLGEVSEAARTFFGLTAAEAAWLPRARLPRAVGYSESLWRVGELHLPLALVASTPEYEFLSSALAVRPAGSGPEDGL